MCPPKLPHIVKPALPALDQIMVSESARLEAQREAERPEAKREIAVVIAAKAGKLFIPAPRSHKVFLQNGKIGIADVVVGENVTGSGAARKMGRRPVRRFSQQAVRSIRGEQNPAHQHLPPARVSGRMKRKQIGRRNHVVVEENEQRRTCLLDGEIPRRAGAFRGLDEPAKFVWNLRFSQQSLGCRVRPVHNNDGFEIREGESLPCKSVENFGKRFRPTMSGDDNA